VSEVKSVKLIFASPGCAGNFFITLWPHYSLFATIKEEGKKSTLLFFIPWLPLPWQVLYGFSFTQHKMRALQAGFSWFWFAWIANVFL
jgi:hypothetical protein